MIKEASQNWQKMIRDPTGPHLAAHISRTVPTGPPPTPTRRFSDDNTTMTHTIHSRELRTQSLGVSLNTPHTPTTAFRKCCPPAVITAEAKTDAAHVMIATVASEEEPIATIAHVTIHSDIIESRSCQRLPQMGAFQGMGVTMHGSGVDRGSPTAENSTTSSMGSSVGDCATTS